MLLAAAAHRLSRCGFMRVDQDCITDTRGACLVAQGAEGSTVEVVVKKADSGEVKTLTATRLRTL